MFKTGDKIRCINVDDLQNDAHITLNKIYVAQENSTSDNVYILNDIGREWGYYPHRFVNISIPNPINRINQIEL